MKEVFTYDSVVFRGKSLYCIKNNENNTIHVAITPILEGIGMKPKQIEYQMKKWGNNPMIAVGMDSFLFPVEKGSQIFRGISLSILQLALEDIDLTADVFDTDREYLCDNVDIYQINCADYIAEHFNNTSHQTITIADTQKPLSREEIAAYMLYEEQHVDNIEKTVTAFMNNQTEIIKSFIAESMKTQNNFCSSALSVIEKLSSESTAPAAVTPSVTYQPEVAEVPRDTWKRDTALKIRKFAADNNCNILRVYSRLSGLLLTKYNIDTKTLRQLYAAKHHLNEKKVSLLEVISTYPSLRRQFETCFDSLLSGESVINYAADQNPMVVPRIIVEKVNSIPGSKSVRSTLHRIYLQMESRLGKPLKEYVDGYCKQNGIPRAIIAYVVANVPELLKVFDEVVDDMS